MECGVGRVAYGGAAAVVVEKGGKATSGPNNPTCSLGLRLCTAHMERQCHCSLQHTPLRPKDNTTYT